MGYYEKNIEFILQYDQLLYDNYLLWKNDKHQNETIIHEECAKDGGVYLMLERDGKSYRLNSCYSPKNEAEEWVRQFSLNNLEQVIMMMGIGNGVFYRELKAATKRDAHFLIYEPSIEIFDYLMNNVDLMDLICNCNCNFLVHGLNEERFINIAESILGWENINFLITTEHPGYRAAFPEEYQWFCKKARDGWSTSRINRNTIAYFSESMAKNSLYSLTCLPKAHFYHQYMEIFRDLSAIIVSAGPSLDKNIQELRKAKGKAVIFAVDTAMRELNKYGIEPDFVVTVDPEKPLSYMSEEGTGKVPLFCTDCANREILMQHEAKKIFFDVQSFVRKLQPKSVIEEVGFGSGGSVATSAFSLCKVLGFKKIILIGQDLAYANGVSHAGNRMVGEDTQGRAKMVVEDVYGNPITTRREWYQFLIWFNNAIEKIDGDITVIDATEGGAKIEGTLIMTLSEAIEKYCIGAIDCKKVVNEMPNAYSVEEIEEIKIYIKNMIGSFGKLSTDLKKVVLDLEQLCRNCEEKRFDKQYRILTKQILKTGNRIQEREAYELLNMWNAKRAQTILDNINRMSEQLEENELKVYRCSMEYYKSLEEALVEVKPLLEDTYKEMCKENAGC